MCKCTLSCIYTQKKTRIKMRSLMFYLINCIVFFLKVNLYFEIDFRNVGTGVN